MANKKKVTTAVVAVVMAAVLLLGGTFAWQSINQTALNEASDVINPGGRLHDDFNGSNKDVYVENFAENKIFARIRLDEYFSVTMNKGTNGEIFNEIAGTMDTDTGEITEWVTHYFDSDSYNATDDYWDWQTGGSTVFMPTFNKNKDSLEADINGTYNGNDNYVTDAADDDRYTDYVKYYLGQTESGEAIYDTDSNTDEDDGVEYVSETHTATTTLGATLMSMQEWIDAGSQPGDYWVYDTDGWVYWANAIQPGEATGLLLDGISLDEKLDDSWYYAINVVAQFITADDLGKKDGTGFYDTENGTVPSEDALVLLEAIGVNVSGENTGDDDEEPEISDQPLDITISYQDGKLAGVPPTDYETGIPEDGVTQIFAIGIDNKDLYLGGTLTLDDGSKLSSATGDFDVTFTLNSYESNMIYTRSSDSDGETEYTFTISTIEDESSTYNGYKVATCDQTKEKMMVLNEKTGHMVMLAENQPVNQAAFVTAHATYNNVEYTSVDNWELFFVNRDIVMFINPQEDTDTPSHGATYTPGTASTYYLTADLLYENETVTDFDKYPVTWKVFDNSGNEVTDGSVTLNTEKYNATLTVSENAKSLDYRVVASYTHNYDDGKNKGLYDTGWSVTNVTYGSEEDPLIKAVDGNIQFGLSDIGNSFDCDETVTFTINGYDDMSLFEWEIIEGVGTCAVEGRPGVFTHYSQDTEEYGECGCITTIKATLKSDSSVWGSISFTCA